MTAGHMIDQSPFGWSVGQSVGQSVSRSVSQSVGWSAGRSLSRLTPINWKVFYKKYHNCSRILLSYNDVIFNS